MTLMQLIQLLETEDNQVLFYSFLKECLESENPIDVADDMVEHFFANMFMIEVELSQYQKESLVNQFKKGTWTAAFGMRGIAV